jgi:CTP-dependent riboflavin kinase
LNTESERDSLKIVGTVTTGTGEAGRITELPWVKIQFIEKLGIDPHPGTFNIEAAASDLHKLNILRHAKAIEILPAQQHHCKGISFHALIAGKVRGAVIIPMIPDYPPEKLELISKVNIKKALGIKDGDLVDIEVYLS